MIACIENQGIGEALLYLRDELLDSAVRITCRAKCLAPFVILADVVADILQHFIWISAQNIHRYLIWTVIRRRVDKVEGRLFYYLHLLRRFSQEYMVVNADPSPRSILSTEIGSLRTSSKPCARPK